MVHPVKTPLGAARAVTHLSLTAVRHPMRTVGDVTALGRGLLGSVVTAVRPEHGTPGIDSDEPIANRSSDDEGVTLKKQGDPVDRGASSGARSEGVAAPDDSSATHDSPEAHAAAAAPAATVERAAPAEPADPHGQVVTEPSSVIGAGDDEEIPSPAVPYEEDDLEVITPVGTTGAGPGFNPDTNETDLQQPGTEPLMDPSTTKRIKSESDVLRRASDPRKE